ncbi:hypothetical protein [Streptomyces galbus]|uniref:Uncharacterized protein n=1 Tax=Streptomyces galbus TaxID=33898 RepID=A0A4U5W4J6_STRGB|nr:hypothetical protein [Streptomyces galbus]TKS95811.1 hypothetical protein E4U92_35045 [Streptomyces galbus]GHD52446.1 hypothetical protein GCM10010335_64960 [Streptomyces galbus]
MLLAPPEIALHLGAAGIGCAGEHRNIDRLIEVFAAPAAHAVAIDASVSAAQFDALPVRTVAEAATGKRDLKLLAGLPDRFADARDEQSV